MNCKTNKPMMKKKSNKSAMNGVLKKLGWPTRKRTPKPTLK